MEEVRPINFEHAPRGVRVGRVLMNIGCILFFLAFVGNIAAFVLAIAMPEQFGIDWSNVSQIVQFGSGPFLAVFFLLAGIGGLSYVYDKGPLKRMATLAAVVMLVVFVIDTILSVRSLVHDLIGGQKSQTDIWVSFFINLLDIQLSGGLYFIGWFLCKDYMGD